MQESDTLSQLAACCGLGPRRRWHRTPRNYYRGPQTTNLDPRNEWALANYYGHQPQPYILLTQPVIIAGNPAQNQANTMTLVQQAQSVPGTATFPALSIMGQPTVQESIQPNILSSQYAVYNSSTAFNTSIMTVPISNVRRSQQGILDGNSYALTGTSILPMIEAGAKLKPERREVTLNAELLKQLEVIEQQVDISRDMDLVENCGIVITRALDPYSLMPHLTDAMLRRYQTCFLSSDLYVIKFIEVIKRPGQTLGLYIRTVQFEDSRSGSSRAGVVITKIDSDSPVYNSQVIHIGDEILSVNLVDIQGMSMDDVVVIMSIPKRLVLALKAPRDRDQLSSPHHRQQPGLSSIQQTNDSPTVYRYERHTSPIQRESQWRNATPSQERAYSRVAEVPFETEPREKMGFEPPRRTALHLGETPEQSRYFSSSIDAINRELKELRRQRVALDGGEDLQDPMRFDP